MFVERGASAVGVTVRAETGARVGKGGKGRQNKRTKILRRRDLLALFDLYRVGEPDTYHLREEDRKCGHRCWDAKPLRPPRPRYQTPSG